MPRKAAAPWNSGREKTKERVCSEEGVGYQQRGVTPQKREGLFIFGP